MTTFGASLVGILILLAYGQVKDLDIKEQVVYLPDNIVDVKLDVHIGETEIRSPKTSDDVENGTAEAISSFEYTLSDIDKSGSNNPASSATLDETKKAGSRGDGTSIYMVPDSNPMFNSANGNPVSSSVQLTEGPDSMVAKDTFSDTEISNGSNPTSSATPDVSKNVGTRGDGLVVSMVPDSNPNLNPATRNHVSSSVKLAEVLDSPVTKDTFSDIGISNGNTRTSSATPNETKKVGTRGDGSVVSMVPDSIPSLNSATRNQVSSSVKLTEVLDSKATEVEPTGIGIKALSKAMLSGAELDKEKLQEFSEILLSDPATTPEDKAVIVALSAALQADSSKSSKEMKEFIPVTSVVNPSEPNSPSTRLAMAMNEDTPLSEEDLESYLKIVRENHPKNNDGDAKDCCDFKDPDVKQLVLGLVKKTVEENRKQVDNSLELRDGSELNLGSLESDGDARNLIMNVLPHLVHKSIDEVKAMINYVQKLEARATKGRNDTGSDKTTRLRILDEDELDPKVLFLRRKLKMQEKDVNDRIQKAVAMAKEEVMLNVEGGNTPKTKRIRAFARRSFENRIRKQLISSFEERRKNERIQEVQVRNKLGKISESLITLSLKKEELSYTLHSELNKFGQLDSEGKSKLKPALNDIKYSIEQWNVRLFEFSSKSKAFLGEAFGELVLKDALAVIQPVLDGMDSLLSDADSILARSSMFSSELKSSLTKLRELVMRNDSLEQLRASISSDWNMVASKFDDLQRHPSGTRLTANLLNRYRSFRKLIRAWFELFRVTSSTSGSQFVRLEKESVEIHLKREAILDVLSTLE